MISSSSFADVAEKKIMDIYKENNMPMPLSSSEKDTYLTLSDSLYDGFGEKEYWAVLVGINNYPGQSNDLPYSINEITSFKNALLQGRNWLPSHIRIVSDKNATREGIFDALEWLDEQEDENDVSVFYYVGHGSQDYGVNESLSVYNSKIYDEELDIQLDNLEGRVVIILDCCYSGGFIEELGQWKRVILTACRKDEKAYQFEELKSGIFGYFVNMYLEKLTKTAELTFLFSFFRTIYYTEQLSEEFNDDYTMHPKIYDGCFGPVKIIKHLFLRPVSFGQLISSQIQNNPSKIWEL